MASGIEASISALLTAVRRIPWAWVLVGVVVLAGVLIVASGSGRRFPFVGDWLGHRPVAGQPGANPDVLVSLATVEAKIGPNGHFDLATGGLDYSGQVSYDGGSALLVPDSVEGRPIDRQTESVKSAIPTVRLTPNYANGTLTETETNGGKEPVVLKRQQP